MLLQKPSKKSLKKTHFYLDMAYRNMV